MLRSLLICALLVGVSQADSSQVDQFTQEENVLVLKSDNFQDALKLKFLLVEFYAPWCGHCKALAPEFAAAATQLRNEESEIYLGKVDATQETQLAEQFEVRGYPTLKFFINGSPIEYTGGRTAEQLKNWLLKKTGPAAATLASEEEAKKFVESADVTVVGFFEDVESEQAKAYLDAAMELDDVAFGLVQDKSLFSSFEVPTSSVILFKKFDEGRNTLDLEEISKDAVKKFIAANSLPLVVEFSHQTAQKIFGGDVKAHNLLFLSKKSSEAEETLEAFRKVASDFKNKVLFVTIDTDVEDHERIMEFFGLKKTDVPEMRLIKLEEEMTKFKPPTKELTLESIQTFVQGVMEGTIKQHLLSQEPPENWESLPVKPLVSTTFDSVAFDPKKTVLVEFYAPWCGHCKQLEPVYNELGAKYADKDDVVIAKMDATANELEHTKINSFPTIKLYKKETNEVVEYNGERTLEGLNKFIETDGEYGRAAPDQVVDFNGERNLEGMSAFVDSDGTVGASPKTEDQDEEEEKPEEGAAKHEEL